MQNYKISIFSKNEIFSYFWKKLKCYTQPKSLHFDDPQNAIFQKMSFFAILHILSFLAFTSISPDLMYKAYCV